MSLYKLWNFHPIWVYSRHLQLLEDIVLYLIVLNVVLSHLFHGHYLPLLDCVFAEPFCTWGAWTWLKCGTNCDSVPRKRCGVCVCVWAMLCHSCLYREALHMLKSRREYHRAHSPDCLLFITVLDRKESRLWDREHKVFGSFKYSGNTSQSLTKICWRIV